MKLMYFANARIPTEKAHGFQIMTMCDFFSRQNNQVILVLPTRHNLAYKKINPFAHYQIEPKFTIAKLWCFDPVWLMSFWSGCYIKIQAIFFITSLFVYLLFLKNRKEYIFYTRDEHLLPLLQLFSRRVVWESHSLPRHYNYYKKYFQRCQRLISLTSIIKQKLAEQGIDGAKILVAPDAVDLKIFDVKITKSKARQGLNLPADKIILGYTGCFRTKNQDKGLLTIFEALKILNDHKYFFVAYGGSPEELNDYFLLAQKIGVADQVLLNQRVNQRDLAIFQKACDILLMPFPRSEHYENYMSPLKMFEYMAAGRPIIATNLPSIRDVLNDKNSVLIKPDNSKELSAALHLLTMNPDLAAALSTHACEDANKYTWSLRAEKIINFIPV